MSTETNKAVCRRMLDQLYNQHRPDLVPEFFTEDLVLHVGRASRDLPIGMEGFKERVAMALAAFPDIQIRVDDEIAEGDRVAVRWTVTGPIRASLEIFRRQARRLHALGSPFTVWSMAKLPKAGSSPTI